MLRTGSELFQTGNLRPLMMVTAILALAWVITVWVLQETSASVTVGGMVLFGLVIVVTTLRDWRTGCYLFFTWLLFEDLVRKYLGNNMVIYFTKDFLAGVTYLSFFTAYRRGRAESFRPPFLLAFMLFFWLGAVQMFNPNSPSILYGLLGMKLYFYYVPLMFIGYGLVRTENDLHRFLMANAWLAGIIALLGIIQALVGPEFLNPPVLAPELKLLGTMVRMAPISGQPVYRPTSVFVSDGRFYWYLILVWILGLGAAGYLLLRTRRGRKTIFISFAIVTGAALLCGSRAAAMWVLSSALVMASGLLWGAPWRWQQGHRLVKAIRRSFLLAGIGVVYLVLFFPEAVGARWAFYSETLSPDSPKSELTWRAWDYPLMNLNQAFAHPDWPTGYGIGTASLGVQYVSRLLEDRPPPVSVESGFGTLIVELGIAGPIVWLAWVLTLLVKGWGVVRRLKATPYFPVGFAIYWYMFVLVLPFMFMSMAPYQNFVLNAYFWLLVGVFFRLPTLLQQDPLEGAAVERGLK